MGDFQVGEAAVSLADGAVGRITVEVVIGEVVVFKDDIVRVVAAGTRAAVINEAVARYTRAVVLNDGKAGTGVLREDAVFHQRIATGNHHRCRAAHQIQARVLKIPDMVRRELRDVDAAHGEMMLAAASAEGTAALTDFHRTGSGIAAEVIGNLVLLADVVAGAVILRVFQCGRRLVFHIKRPCRHFILAEYLAQRLIVDKHLLRIGRHFGKRRICGKRADMAEILKIPRHLPKIAFLLEALGRNDGAAFQPDITMRLRLQGNVVLGHKKMRLAVCPAFQDDGRAIRRPLHGSADGIQRLVATAITASRGIGGNPEDVFSRDGIIRINRLILVIHGSVRLRQSKRYGQQRDGRAEHVRFPHKH